MRSCLRPALAILSLFPAVPAFAIDCGKAKLPLETAICADPPARDSDAAMEAAFEALRAASQGAERKSALEDQRAWLKERNAACGNVGTQASCVRDSNLARVDVLKAKPESGPGLERPLQPVFVRQAGDRRKIDIAVQVLRFPDPQTAGERALNAKADEALKGLTLTKEEPDEREWSFEQSWTIAYASPSFLSIRTQYEDYSGGAHGNRGNGGLHIDMKSGRVLAFTDLFDSRALKEIDALCKKQVEAEKKERGGEDETADLEKRIDDVAKDLSNWVFAEREATVFFDQYTVGSYAEGPYDCTIPSEALSKLAKRPIPLR